MADESQADYRRRLWLRPNAHLYIRHDAYRFMPPGAPRWAGRDVVRYFWPDQQHDQPAEKSGSVPAFSNPHALAWTGKRGRWMPENPGALLGGGRWQNGGEPKSERLGLAELRCSLATLKSELA